MIHIEGLNKRYGERILFEDVSWHVKKRDRIGLSGPNGSGKTTLLKMLAGLQEADSGSIRMASDTTIGYLPQDGIVHHGRSVYDEVVLAFQELLALKAEQHEIEDRLAHATEDGGHDKLLERYAEVTERFKQLGGWEIDARVADVLKGLGFSLADQQRRNDEEGRGGKIRGHSQVAGFQPRPALDRDLLPFNRNLRTELPQSDFGVVSRTHGLPHCGLPLSMQTGEQDARLHLSAGNGQ